MRPMEGKLQVTILNEIGHESMEVTTEEAERLITVNMGRYFVVNEETQELLQELKLEPGQRIALIPIATGG